MKKLLLLVLGAALALAPPVIAQTIPGGGGGGGTSAPCSAFGTTTGTCLQGAGALGTPASGTATNLTGLPVSTGVSGLGTGVATALGTNVGSAGAPVVNGGALGTPSSGTGTNLTGVPISTGVSGLGTGVGTALGVNVGSAGAPVVNGGALGTPSSGTLTSATGLPIATGVSGLGSGVATALAVAHDATGGICTVGGSGCPGGGSGSVTSITAGAGINLSTNPCTTTCTAATTWAINAQTGTTYTVVSGDAAKLVTFSNASAIAVTLPQATGSFAAGFAFDVQNKGAGAVTITPTTSTINGASTLVIPQNYGCSIVSDGTNYQVSACLPAASFTGTGNIVRGTSPTLVTPALGTPSAVVLTNATGLVASTGTTATGTPSSTTYLRGDNTWSTPAGGGTVTTLTAGTNITFSSGATCTTTCTINASGGGSGAFTLISTLTASNSATLAWTGLTGTGYLLTCQTLLPVSNGVNAIVQFGEGGTPTWETASYVSGAGVGYTTGGGGLTPTGDVNGIDVHVSTIGNTGGGLIGLNMNTYNLAGATQHTVTWESTTATGGGGQAWGSGGGFYNGDTNAITAIRILFTSGNITSGSCSLYSRQT